MIKVIVTFHDQSRGVAYSTAKNYNGAIMEILGTLTPAMGNMRLVDTMREAGVVSFTEARASESVTWEHIPRHYLNTTHGVQTLKIAALRGIVNSYRGIRSC